MKMGRRSHGGEKRTTRLAGFGICLVVIKSVEIMAHRIDLGAGFSTFFPVVFAKFRFEDAHILLNKNTCNFE